MTYFWDTPANVAALARAFGFAPVVARAWLRSEGQSVPNPTNPLNIEAGGVTADLQTHQLVGRFAAFPTASAGIEAAHELVSRLAGIARYGYAEILRQAGSGNAIAQARAVELSSWASGHYGASAVRDGTIARQVRAALSTHPKGGTTMAVHFALERFHAAAGVQIFDAPGGTLLGAYHAGYDVTSLEATDDDAWRGVITTTGGVERVVWVRRADLASPITAPPAGWADELHSELRDGEFLAPPADQAPPPPTPPALDPSWTTADLTGTALDEYAYAKQLYTAMHAPAGTPMAPVFTQVNQPGPLLSDGTQTGTVGSYMLGELVGAMIGDGQTTFSLAVYPEIPAEVIAAGGPTVLDAARRAKADVLANGRAYVPRPEAALIGLD